MSAALTEDLTAFIKAALIAHATGTVEIEGLSKESAIFVDQASKAWLEAKEDAFDTYPALILLHLMISGMIGSGGR